MGFVLSSMIHDIQRPPFGDEERIDLSEFCASICVIFSNHSYDRDAALDRCLVPDTCVCVQLLEHPHRATRFGRENGWVSFIFDLSKVFDFGLRWLWKGP